MIYARDLEVRSLIKSQSLRLVCLADKSLVPFLLHLKSRPLGSINSFGTSSYKAFVPISSETIVNGWCIYGPERLVEVRRNWPSQLVIKKRSSDQGETIQAQLSRSDQCFELRISAILMAQ